MELVSAKPKAGAHSATPQAQTARKRGSDSVAFKAPSVVMQHISRSWFGQMANALPISSQCAYRSSAESQTRFQCGVRLRGPFRPIGRAFVGKREAMGNGRITATAASDQPTARTVKPDKEARQSDGLVGRDGRQRNRDPFWRRAHRPPRRDRSSHFQRPAGLYHIWCKVFAVLIR